MSTEIKPHGAVSHRNEIAVKNAAELAEVERYDRLRTERITNPTNFNGLVAYRYNQTTKRFEGPNPQIAEVFDVYYNLAIRYEIDDFLRDKSHNTDDFYLDSSAVNFIHYPFDYVVQSAKDLLNEYINRPRQGDFNNRVLGAYNTKLGILKTRYPMIMEQLLSMLDNKDRNWKLLRLVRRITNDYNGIAGKLAREYTLLTEIPKEPYYFVPPSAFNMYTHSDHNGISQLENIGHVPLNQYDIYYRRPFDPSGNNPENFIVETVVLTDKNRNDFSFILPRFAPFFVNSLVVHRKETDESGVEAWHRLYPNVDYYTGGLFGEMSAYTMDGALVAGTIIFRDIEINGTYKLEYQTLGGDFALDGKGFAEAVAHYLESPLFSNWGEIIGKPIDLSTLQHKLDVSDLRGLGDFLGPINDIRELLKQFLTEENTEDQHALLEELDQLTSDVRESSKKLREEFANKTQEVINTAERIEGIVQQQRDQFQNQFDDNIARINKWVNDRLIQNNNEITDEIRREVKRRLDDLKEEVSNELERLENAAILYDRDINRDNHPYGNANAYVDDVFYHTKEGNNSPQKHSLKETLNSHDGRITDNREDIDDIKELIGTGVMRIFPTDTAETQYQPGNHYSVPTYHWNDINKIPRIMPTVPIANNSTLGRLSFNVKDHHGTAMNTANLVYHGAANRWYGYETTPSGTVEPNTSVEFLTTKNLSEFGAKWNNRLTDPADKNNTYGKRKLYSDDLYIRVQPTDGDTEIKYKRIHAYNETISEATIKQYNRLSENRIGLNGIFETNQRDVFYRFENGLIPSAHDFYIIGGSLNNTEPDRKGTYYSLGKTLDYLMGCGEDENKYANFVRYTTGLGPKAWKTDVELNIPITKLSLYRKDTNNFPVEITRTISTADAGYLAHYDPSSSEVPGISMTNHGFPYNNTIDFKTKNSTTEGGFTAIRVSDVYLWVNNTYGVTKPISVKHSFVALRSQVYSNKINLDRILDGAGDLTLRSLNDSLNTKIDNFIYSKNYVRNNSPGNHQINQRWEGNNIWLNVDGVELGHLHRSSRGYVEVNPRNGEYGGLDVVRTGNQGNWSSRFEALPDKRWKFWVQDTYEVFIPVKSGTVALLSDINDRVQGWDDWGQWSQMVGKAPMMHGNGDIWVGKQLWLMDTDSNRDANKRISLNYYRDSVKNDNAVYISGCINVADIYVRSDRRIKEDLRQIENPLAIVKSLNAYKYRLKQTGQENYGVIAQELEEILPELVTQVHTEEFKDDPLRSVKYDGLVAVLLESVKAQQAQIEQQQQQINQLQLQLNTLLKGK